VLPAECPAGWSPARVDVLVVGLVAIGLLNPDEALHYLIAEQPSATAVYRASLPQAHPPLYFLLLHYWMYWGRLGTSEFVMRLPSVLAGAALPWVVERWVRGLFGRPVSLIALGLTALSPSLIALSAELRGYAVLFLFIGAALVYLEQALETGARRSIALFALFLYLAIVTHYATLVFTVALGTYTVYRIRTEHLPAGTVRRWVTTQIGAALLYAWLYVTHISKLRGGAMEQEAKGGWLLREFFNPHERNPLAYVARQTGDAFQYMFGQNEVGIVMMLIFVGGIWLLLRRSAVSELGPERSRRLGLLLLLPFVVNCAAGLAGLYPYGNTRHSVYLALFAFAGVSFVFARWLASRPLVGGPVIAVLVLVPLVSVTQGIVHPGRWARSVMASAIADIRQMAPGTLIFTDQKTGAALNYYLGRGQPPAQALEHYAGYRVVRASFYAFDPGNFRAEFDRVASGLGLRSGERVWVVSMPWGPPDLYATLSKELPQLEYLNPRIYGGQIAIFQVTVGGASPRS
jgi:4-amino-4-deoxy-L-arabinose transferase-like glycosyltransferase